METQYKPNYVIHPGEYLAEVLEARSITQVEFSERTGLSQKTISLILSGKTNFSTEVALVFERTLGISANLWIRLLENYLLFHARNKERKKLSTNPYQQFLKKFPISDLQKLGILSKVKDSSRKVEELLQFLNIASPDAWENYDINQLAHYRRNTEFPEKKNATAVWLHLAKKISERQTLSVPYSKERITSYLSLFRKLTLENPKTVLSSLENQCITLGIRIVFVPELRDTHLSGAAFWIGSHPSIALSFRYKSNDHFWFSFFHELGHILLHSKKLIHLDANVKPSSFMEREEQEADSFGADTLIPPSSWKQFISRKAFTESTVVKFANEIKIHTGIVVGRLQRERMIHFSSMNSFKEKWEVPLSVRLF